VTLAAWSVIKEQHGLVKVTIRELRDPAGLWQALREDGVPANVRFLHHDFVPTTSAHDLPKGCLAPRMSDAANAGLQEKIMPGAGPQNGVVLKIRPSAIPHGIGLYLKAWAASPGANGGLSLQTDLVQATPLRRGRLIPTALGGRCPSLVACVRSRSSAEVPTPSWRPRSVRIWASPCSRYGRAGSPTTAWKSSCSPTAGNATSS
jgi:hypothetical protein